MGNFFLWGGCSNGGSNEGRIKDFLATINQQKNFVFCHRSFWVSSPTVQELSSPMC
jgi:hypothetical protein